LHEALELDVVAVRLGRRLREDEALAGDRILDGVACANHWKLLPSWSQTTLGRTAPRHIGPSAGIEGAPARRCISVLAPIAVFRREAKDVLHERAPHRRVGRRDRERRLP